MVIEEFGEEADWEGCVAYAGKDAWLTPRILSADGSLYSSRCRDDKHPPPLFLCTLLGIVAAIFAASALKLHSFLAVKAEVLSPDFGRYIRIR